LTEVIKKYSKMLLLFLVAALSIGQSCASDSTVSFKFLNLFKEQKKFLFEKGHQKYSGFYGIITCVE
jgi:hypothetical protein